MSCLPRYGPENREAAARSCDVRVLTVGVHRFSRAERIVLAQEAQRGRILDVDHLQSSSTGHTELGAHRDSRRLEWRRGDLIDRGLVRRVGEQRRFWAADRKLTHCRPLLATRAAALRAAQCIGLARQLACSPECCSCRLTV